MSRRRVKWHLLTMLLAFSAAVSNARAADPIPEVLASGLQHPWSLAFLPDGRLLITERAGRLRVFANCALLPASIKGLPPIHVAGQGGLLEVLPAPDFVDSGWLYFSYSHGTAKASTTRLARGRLVDSELRDVEVLFSALPERATSVHYGGRMAWLADGTLLLTLGDGFDYRERAQSLADHLGSIVRLNADGSVPADNPFVGRADARAEIFSYGHRNVQGIVVVRDSAGAEQIYAHEHGPRGGDELNHIHAGANYGWPLATFGIDYNGAKVSPFTDAANTQPPVLQWTPSIAPAGMAYSGNAKSERAAAWSNSFFVASLAEKSLRQLRLGANGNVEQRVMLQDRKQRLRDVRVGPDGALYLLTDSDDGELLRLKLP